MTTIVDLRYCTPDEKYKVCRAYSKAFNRDIDLGYRGISNIRSIIDTPANYKARGRDFMPWVDIYDKYYSAKTFINLGSL